MQFSLRENLEKIIQIYSDRRRIHWCWGVGIGLEMDQEKVKKEFSGDNGNVLCLVIRITDYTGVHIFQSRLNSKELKYVHLITCILYINEIAFIVNTFDFFSFSKHSSFSRILHLHGFSPAFLAVASWFPLLVLTCECSRAWSGAFSLFLQVNWNIFYNT